MALKAPFLVVDKAPAMLPKRREEVSREGIWEMAERPKESTWLRKAP